MNQLVLASRGGGGPWAGALAKLLNVIVGHENWRLDAGTLVPIGGKRMTGLSLESLYPRETLSVVGVVTSGLSGLLP